MTYIEVSNLKVNHTTDAKPKMSTYMMCKVINLLLNCRDWLACMHTHIYFIRPTQYGS